MCNKTKVEIPNYGSVECAHLQKLGRFCLRKCGIEIRHHNFVFYNHKIMGVGWGGGSELFHLDQYYDVGKFNVPNIALSVKNLTFFPIWVLLKSPYLIFWGCFITYLCNYIFTFGSSKI